MKIVIIGAGISGLLSAYYLLQKGHSVLILESASHVASKASGANAAQLSYSYVNPIGSPSLPKMLPAILMGRKKGFRIKKFNFRLLKWGMKLLRESTNYRFKKNRNDLLELSLQSRKLFTELKSETGISFKNYSTGKLQILDSEALKKSAEEFSQVLSSKGITLDILPRDECAKKLNNFALDDSFVSSVFSSIDETADCAAFCKSLLEYLRLNPNFTLFFDSAVKEWESKNNQISSLITKQGNRIKADAYLLCTGAQTNRLVKPLGLHFPIYPIRGYTLVYSYKSSLTCSVTDHKNKVVFVPHGDHLLVSGMFHFAGENTTIDGDTVQHIHECATSRIKELENINYKIRCGLRPCTPSSTPIIKQTDYQNLYINSGQGMYGWTLSTACAKRTADLISNH